MRFLQMEWHNHERARNSWDIEKAEMKQKLTKLQGENNNLKRTNQVLEKHVKMLEKVILNERAKHKAALAGDKLPPDDDEAIDFKAKAALKAELKNGNSCSRAWGTMLMSPQPSRYTAPFSIWMRTPRTPSHRRRLIDHENT
jgi:hypothetical protein